MNTSPFRIPAAFLLALSACGLSFVVRALIAWIARHGFTPFAWYRIVVGTAMLALLYLR